MTPTKPGATDPKQVMGAKGTIPAMVLRRSVQVYHDRQVVDAFTGGGYTLDWNDEDENGWALWDKVM